jgi:hypothetical protein
MSSFTKDTATTATSTSTSMTTRPSTSPHQREENSYDAAPFSQDYSQPDNLVVVSENENNENGAAASVSVSGFLMFLLGTLEDDIYRLIGFESSAVALSAAAIQMRWSSRSANNGGASGGSGSVATGDAAQVKFYHHYIVAMLFS